MADYDLVIRGGTVVTAADTYRADVGVRDGRIAAIGDNLDGTDRLDVGQDVEAEIFVERRIDRIA